ncbi:MAG: Single-stranded-DNA-specific exonuclease [Berkelbacteria bacterium GW2011_GWA1_36_9]|uniref:Single-stranded-DNA-specific exonuclease RecJ n=2 Tax=Candidatus Berkelbacteria TaxID=1618330 RepID=A0A0G0FLZ5_9BACT|nr:MAG: Single-stranded-DNA-specific exonuclease [Berkelbacteria bacterium GW2011_GWA1_36_9]
MIGIYCQALNWSQLQNSDTIQSRMKKWIISPKKSNDIIEQLLINRKIKKEEWSSFLNPDFSNLFDPFKIGGMKEAVLRIEKAYLKKEVIGIFGDYDADGIPGSALLYQYLTKIGFKTHVYIPRREQGYGLNKEGIEVLKKEGVSLLITIDLGVRNSDEIEYAKKIGINVIILDHHEMAKEKPNCIVVDLKQAGEKYPFTELAATGVVFKFIQAINLKLKKVPTNHLKWMLDLVAISTICDMVPLVSENRIFAKFGLIVLQKTRNLGLKELYKKAEIVVENIDTYTVGFQIGPRINAPGRMDHTNESFYLLISADQKEASVLAEKLDTINRQRQKELQRVLLEAREKVVRKKLDQKKLILVEGENWPQGIVGLVAGKLMEEYSRPVIVCERKEGKLKGSARSISAYNMVEALEQAKDYLLKYGGHKKAAGLSLDLKQWSNLYNKLLEVADVKLSDKDLMPKIKIDLKLKKEDLKLALFDKIKKLEPFGLGNNRPIFQLEQAQITDVKTVGKKKEHLKFKADDISAIGFGMGDLEKTLKNGKADIVFTLDEDNWSIRKLQLKVLDLKVA